MLGKVFLAVRNAFKAFLSVVLNKVGVQRETLPKWAGFYSLAQEIYEVESKGEGGVIISEVNGNLYIAAGIGILAGLVARKKGASVIFLDFADSREFFIHRLILRSFCSCTFVQLHQQDGQQVLDEKGVEDVEGLRDLRYDDVFVGDIAYDLSLTHGCGRATVDSIDKQVASATGKLWSVLRVCDQIQQDYDVSGVVVSHAVGRGGAVIRYFARKNIPCLQGIVGGGPIRKYERYDGGSLPYTQQVNADRVCEVVKDASPDDRLLQAAEEYMQGRVSRTIRDSDSARAFEGEHITSRSAFSKRFGLPTDRSNVFVMLHAFTDHPCAHHDNQIFKDYYRWFIETLKFAKKREEENWIFKQHPSAHRYPNDANLSGIFEVVQDEHIAFIDANEDFNSKSVIDVADAVVTGKGTAGIEFPCFGVPSITAGGTHYSGLNVANVATSKEEYFDLLRQASCLPEVTPEVQRRARVGFFLLYAVECFLSNNVGLGVDAIPLGPFDEQEVIGNLIDGMEELLEGRIAEIEEFIDSEEKIFVNGEYGYIKRAGLIP